MDGGIVCPRNTHGIVSFCVVCVLCIYPHRLEQGEWKVRQHYIVFEFIEIPELHYISFCNNRCRVPLIPTPMDANIDFLECFHLAVFLAFDGLIFFEKVLGTDRKLSIHSEKHGWTERRDLSV